MNVSMKPGGIYRIARHVDGAPPGIGFFLGNDRTHQLAKNSVLLSPGDVFLILRMRSPASIVPAIEIVALSADGTIITRDLTRKIIETGGDEFGQWFEAI